MPQCRITPMENEVDGRPSHKPSHNVFTAQMQILDEAMTPREIAEAIEALDYQRGRHALLLDRGVRHYLLDLLKARLPRKREDRHEAARQHARRAARPGALG